MTQHMVWFNRAVLDLLHEIFPVVVDRGLTISDEADAAFHKRADVEVIGLEMLVKMLEKSIALTTYKSHINTRHADSSVILHRGDHLVEDLRRIGLCT